MVEPGQGRVSKLLQGQHSAEIRGERLLCPVVELRHAVRADPLDRRAHVRLGKAVRLALRHLIRLGALPVHLIHPLHDPIQNLLLTRIVLIQRGLGDPQPPRNVAHGGPEIPALGKQL